MNKLCLASTLVIMVIWLLFEMYAYNKVNIKAISLTKNMALKWLRPNFGYRSSFIY